MGHIIAPRMHCPLKPIEAQEPSQNLGSFGATLLSEDFWRRTHRATGAEARESAPAGVGKQAERGETGMVESNRAKSYQIAAKTFYPRFALLQRPGLPMHSNVKFVRRPSKQSSTLVESFCLPVLPDALSILTPPLRMKTVNFVPSRMGFQPVNLPLRNRQRLEFQTVNFVPPVYLPASNLLILNQGDE
jgi:hypothetical protein